MDSWKNILYLPNFCQNPFVSSSLLLEIEPAAFAINLFMNFVVNLPEGVLVHISSSSLSGFSLDKWILRIADAITLSNVEFMTSSFHAHSS